MRTESTSDETESTSDENTSHIPCASVSAEQPRPVEKRVTQEGVEYESYVQKRTKKRNNSTSTIHVEYTISNPDNDELLFW